MTMSDGVLWTGPVDSPHRYQVAVEAVAEAVAGGEGLVYRADDTDRGVPVALKLLTVVNVADYGRVVERSVPFTTITHPNLMAHVEVFIGTGLTNDPNPDIADFDVIYTVADWIEGQPLPDVVEAADTGQLLGYIAGVARGLDALHRHRSADALLGIVHRDVKPSNVRVTRDGTAVLIDFGVARPLDHGDLTQGVGTYRWRAPEVLSGSAAISTAVDVWGLGAVAYWALTGQPPSLDGAAAAREHLVNTPRCQELLDPVGVATHIAVLLATNPTQRPTDLNRWATQLEAILTRRRRPGWKRPMTVTVALLSIPSAVLLLDAGERPGGLAASSTTATPTTVTVQPGSSDTVPAEPKLAPAVGDTWNVACLGGVESMIVSGAEPGELILATVEYAAEVLASAPGELPDPNSYATGPNGVRSPFSTSGPPNSTTRQIGGLELTADQTGSVIIEWHCDRSQVGTPFVLKLISGLSERRTEVRIESSDEVVGLTLVTSAREDMTNDDGSIRMFVGTSVVVDVVAELTPAGQAAVRAAGLEYSGLAFDSRMRMTSSNTAVAVVDETQNEVWRAEAVAVGSIVLEAAIPGTDHVGTLRVEVVDRPDPPTRVDERFERGALANYLTDVLNSVGVLLAAAEPEPSQWDTLDRITDWREYLSPLPACGDLPAFSGSDWLQAEELYLDPSVVGPGYIVVTIYTFADASSAGAWSMALRTALESRVGLDCALAEPNDLRRFEAVTDVSPAEFSTSFPPNGFGFSPILSVTTAHNAVIVVEASPDDAATLRGTVAAVLSLPTN